MQPMKLMQYLIYCLNVMENIVTKHFNVLSTKNAESIRIVAFDIEPLGYVLLALLLYYYIHLLTLRMLTFDGRIVGAGGIPWWSSSQVLATNYCVSSVCVCVCVCVWNCFVWYLL